MSDVKPSTPELIETLKHEFEAVKAPSDGYFFPGKIAGVPVLVHRKFVFAGVMWAVFTLIFVDTPWLKTFPQFMPAIIQVLIATLGMAFIVIVHEAGHFFAAWWLRVPIRATVFMPNGGMVITEPMRSGFWRRITVLSAGVLAQAILFVAAQLLLPKLQFSDLIMQPLYFTFIAGNLLFAIGNLLPFNGSDGYQLLAVTSYEAANKLGFDDPQPSADTLRQVKDAVHTGNSDDLSTDTMPIDAEVDMQQRFVSISLFNNTEVTVPAFATIKFHDDAAEHFNARQEITALSTASARRPRAEAANRFLVALLWFIPFSGVIAATFFDISSQAAWFTAGATVLGYLIMLLKNTITYRQYQSMITDHFVAEQNTLAFTHEGIAVLKDTEIAFVNQSTLMRIEETSSNILIFNSASSALIVPKRIFKSTRETGDFIKLVTDNLLSNVEETTRQVADQKQES